MDNNITNTLNIAEKAYLDKYDIMKRYGVGVNQAITIIRSVKSVCGGGGLGKGKLLPSELIHWEEARGKLAGNITGCKKYV